MARKPHDNDPELKALADRRKAMIAQRKTRLGEVLQLSGADGVLDFDQIAGLVRDSLERLAKDPGLAEVWRRKGQEYFRQGRAGARGDTGRTDAHDANSTHGKSRSAATVRPPAPAHGAAAGAPGQLPLDPQG